VAAVFAKNVQIKGISACIPVLPVLQYAQIPKYGGKTMIAAAQFYFGYYYFFTYKK